MDIADEISHKVLNYISVLSQQGYKITVGELNAYMENPARRSQLWIGLSEAIAEKLFENTREYKIKKDIMRLTRSEKLWDEKTKKIVDEALANVNKLKDAINKDGEKLVIMFIPFGWNFKDENIGAKIGYQFKKDLVIPIGGVEQKVKDF